MNEQLVAELRQVARSAEQQLQGMTPRHARFAHYEQVARVSNAAADALEGQS
jgi:hypothetical protein